MAEVIATDKIGKLAVIARDDGTYALDYDGGPYVVLDAMKWAALCRVIRTARQAIG